MYLVVEKGKEKVEQNQRPFEESPSLLVLVFCFFFLLMSDYGQINVSLSVFGWSPGSVLLMFI